MKKLHIEAVIIEDGNLSVAGIAEKFDGYEISRTFTDKFGSGQEVKLFFTVVEPA